MKQYLEMLRDILENGTKKGDRTGTGTLSVFGRQLRFDLGDGFPAVTTKKLFFNSMKVELAWFLKGMTNTSYLHDHNVNIWDEWADADGELGPVYGSQWRNWTHHYDDGSFDEIDQLTGVVEGLKYKPFSRRHIVSAWNVGEIDEMALPPCHLLYQFNARPLSPLGRLEHYRRTHGKELEGCDNHNPDMSIMDAAGVPRYFLDCQMYQRSADMFLGVPFNIASYALLTHIIARATGMAPGHFIHTFGDAHIYLNHIDQVTKQLSRDRYPLPKLSLDPACTGIDDFEPEHAELEGYEHHPAIKAPIAV